MPSCARDACQSGDSTKHPSSADLNFVVQIGDFGRYDGSFGGGDAQLVLEIGHLLVQFSHSLNVGFHCTLRLALQRIVFVLQRVVSLYQLVVSDAKRYAWPFEFDQIMQGMQK
jgi:hypothetical protein